MWNIFSCIYISYILVLGGVELGPADRGRRRCAALADNPWAYREEIKVCVNTRLRVKCTFKDVLYLINLDI